MFNNQNTNNFLFPVFLVILTSWFLILNTNSAIAETSSNNNYNVVLDEFDPQSPDAKPLPSQQEIPKIGNIITSDGLSLSVSLSQTFLDFGQLSPTNPVTRNLLLSVSSTTQGYQVHLFENSPLQTEDKKSTIPDTTCDSGACNHVLPDIWENTLTYGFGVRCDNIKGQGCQTKFTENYYKQVPDNSQNEIPQVEMAGYLPVKNTEVQFTFKANLSGSQENSSYSNIINFVAIPNF